MNLTAGNEKILKILRAGGGWGWEYIWESVLLQHKEDGLDGGLTVKKKKNCRSLDDHDNRDREEGDGFRR